MRVSSFKAQYRQPPLRSATPPPPPYEPLSPILNPLLQAGPANPAGGKDAPPKRDASNDYAATHHAPSNEETYPPAFQLSPPALTFDSPLRAAILPRTRPQQPPPLGSPIDALANAAASSFPTSPEYAPSPRRHSQVSASPAATAVPATNFYALPNTYTDRAAVQYGERPAKRVRSEYSLPYQSQQGQPSRPTTSHIPQWSYNVEQMVDRDARMYQSSSSVPPYPEQINSKRLSDAQLLLDFHHAVSSSHNPQIPPASSDSVGLPAPHNHGSQTMFPVESIGPYNKATYPEANSIDHRYPPVVESRHAPTATALDERPPPPTVQTHTPPEDTVGATSSRLEAEAGGVEEKKPKKHQGWPKGKPRGPRAGVSANKKKKPTPKPKSTSTAASSSAPDQLHSPQSLPADQRDEARINTASDQVLQPPASQPRRHSHSTLFNFPIQDSDPSSMTSRAQSLPIPGDVPATPPATKTGPTIGSQEEVQGQATICAGCHSSESDTLIGDGEQWISCDGCKGWFHFVCAGFKSEREVREIDKFYCNGCKPKFGDTTKVRKSGRAHTAVDYAGLNEGILKTSDDNPEHHYIQAFKSGDIGFSPESFARLPPECVHAEFLEKMSAFTEPVVIPASQNPRPTEKTGEDPKGEEPSTRPDEDQYGYDVVPDDGQDSIDMVIPEGLTVRRVSELYGPNERVPVIDVKAQEGEDKRWTMAKWADYYEQQGEKPVRNVISLEVSRSKLGRLIRRPKVVRDMDLQDSVWPEEERSNAPPVQFYCLMSVADCYTDFHIDFGGSSVYYHIVKGRKTFFFIPPTKQNLKKYEDWCLSPKQSHEFLGQQVKDCYRVDLFPGDTMLIPSGWIHAVWTPEDSLVIGGNYLTRIHYSMQIKVVEIEKNTKVAPKFRYPFFQKIMWLSLIRYLGDDPLPPSVESLLLNGGEFHRPVPVYCETDRFGHNSHLGSENYNSRYYPKSELDGLPDLVNYIWRTVMISLGKIEGITQVNRNAVTRSIPKGHGEPLVLARRFALWVAWKRGNESIPQWAHPDASLPEVADPKSDKKLSAAQIKRIERESLRETLKTVTPRNIRTRGSDPLSADIREVDGQPSSQSTASALPMTGFLRPSREHVTTPKTSQLGPKRIACDACRKRRIRCKHKDDLVESPRTGAITTEATNGTPSVSSSPATASLAVLAKRRQSESDGIVAPPIHSSTANDVRVIITGTPISTEINPEAWANKSNRVKACADCRKSKRRCIHDENGNIDPIKASETPVPRGSVSKKRRISGDNDEGEALSKKMKRDSFAGIINGEVSHHNRYPLARPRSQPDLNEDSAAYSAQQALDLASAEHMIPIDPQLSGDLVEFTHASSSLPTKDTVMSSIEIHDGDHTNEMLESEPIDPQLLDPQFQTPGPAINGHNGNVHRDNSVQASPYPPVMESLSPSYRPVKSIVNEKSPSRSRTSRINGTPRRKSQTPPLPDRMSTTPRSGKKRRNSTVKLESRADSKPSVTSPSANVKEDKASLALAMQLQMEEHGLRRRSK